MLSKVYPLQYGKRIEVEGVRLHTRRTRRDHDGIDGFIGKILADRIDALLAAKNRIDPADGCFPILRCFCQIFGIDGLTDSASAANIDSEFIIHVGRSSRHIEKLSALHR